MGELSGAPTRHVGMMMLISDHDPSCDCPHLLLCLLWRHVLRLFQAGKHGVRLDNTLLFTTIKLLINILRNVQSNFFNQKKTQKVFIFI